VSVRGYDHLQPWLVRRRSAVDDAGPGDAEPGIAADEDVVENSAGDRDEHHWHRPFPDA
jgi:adenylate cyclase